VVLKAKILDSLEITGSWDVAAFLGNFLEKLGRVFYYKVVVRRQLQLTPYNSFNVG
jgi:hypothetical protein